MSAEDVLIKWLWEGADHGQDDRANEILETLAAEGYAVVELSKVDHYDLDRRPVFTSFLFEVTAYVATPLVELWLPERDVDSLFMDAVEARSLAAALLSAADASEVTA